MSALLFGGVGARSAVAIVLVNHLLDGKDGREDVDDDDEMDSALEEKGAAPFGFSADTNKMETTTTRSWFRQWRESLSSSPLWSSRFRRDGQLDEIKSAVE